MPWAFPKQQLLFVFFRLLGPQGLACLAVCKAGVFPSSFFSSVFTHPYQYQKRWTLLQIRANGSMIELSVRERTHTSDSEAVFLKCQDWPLIITHADWLGNK